MMKVKKINTKFKIDAGAPMPVILSNDYKLYLLFYDSQQEDNEMRVVTFQNYAIYKFGLPREDSIENNPYYEQGPHYKVTYKSTDGTRISYINPNNPNEFGQSNFIPGESI